MRTLGEILVETVAHGESVTADSGERIVLGAWYGDVFGGAMGEYL